MREIRTSGLYLHAKVKEPQRDRDGMIWQPRFSQGVSKAKPVQETEAESDKPRPTARQRRCAASRCHDLDGNEHDAERDGSLDQRTSDVDQPQRRRCKCDAVRDSERCHRKGDPSPIPYQDYQGEDEKEMIEPEQDMFDPKPQLCRGNSQVTCCGQGDDHGHSQACHERQARCGRL